MGDGEMPFWGVWMDVWMGVAIMSLVMVIVIEAGCGRGVEVWIRRHVRIA